MRGRSVVWAGSRVGLRGSWSAARLAWRLAQLLGRLARSAVGHRRRAGGFVARTAVRRRAEAVVLSALALLAALGAVESIGSLEILLAVAGLALCLATWRTWQVAGRHSAGAASERAVARALRPLERSGWLVLHDLEKSSGGNVDHFAAGRGGAFTIETKTVGYGRSHLGQALDHALWAERRLGLPVVPVLCLARGREPPYEDRGVVVCGASELADFLARRKGPSDDTRRILRRLRV